MSDKYDLTQHPNYKLTGDYDKKNTFNIEKFLDHRLKRGVRPFLSDKYDLTQHPNYKLTGDYDKKNTFNIEKFLDHRLKLKPSDTYDVVETDEI